MTVSWLLKPSSISILITLLMTLQIAACNSNGPVETTNDTIVSDNTDDTIAADNTDDTIAADNTDTTALSGVSLSWAAPTEREDNEPISLSEIAGYKVYYGTSANDYHKSVDINDGSAVGYTFTDFSAGTYYFALTTYDTEGRESQQSPAIKIIV